MSTDGNRCMVYKLPSYRPPLVDNFSFRMWMALIICNSTTIKLLFIYLLLLIPGSCWALGWLLYSPCWYHRRKWILPRGGLERSDCEFAGPQLQQSVHWAHCSSQCPRRHPLEGSSQDHYSLETLANGKQTIIPNTLKVPPDMFLNT